MQRAAADLGAEGIVGVGLTEHGHGWGGRIIEFFAIGTAIVHDHSIEPGPSPAAVIDLSR